MTVRITWKRAGLALLALVIAAALFAWSGLFNVAASTGHWKITDLVVHGAMRASVRTHTWLDPPEKVRDDTGLVSAAGHFAQACAACHGAPGVPPLPVMQRAMPPAPHLPDHLHEWSDKQLAWILQHGVRLTGMPAWGAADRPDEVARMTAFVRRLGTMTPAQYDALLGPREDATLPGVAPQTLAGCVGCHGADGRGRGQRDIPVLGGQDPRYLARALADYASGRRHSAVMGQAAATLDPAAREALARHFAAMPGIGQAVPTADAAAARIVARGLPDVQLPACASCHKPGGRAPVIAGQRASYLAQRLRLWRGEKEVVDARKPQDVMAAIARRIPEDMIDRLAAHYAGGAPYRPTSSAVAN